MRKLSMKGKRGKSETSSEGDSEENGVGVKPAVPNDTAPAQDTPKIQKKTKKGRRSQAEENKQAGVTDESITEQENGSPAKKRKRNLQTQPSTSEENPDEEEYEVLKVVGQRTIKGRRQFRVRWKGYSENDDTWEEEKNLNCQQLIDEYLEELAESNNTDKSVKTLKTPKERRDVAKAKTPKSAKTKKNVTDTKNSADDDAKETEEFEVEKIQEVHFHRKNKKREFLIRWKGFSPAEDTWEPEENLNCPELIAKFMDKVEAAKKTELKELRTNPAHTKRYTLMSTEHGRRLSRRNMNKQRATYYRCDE